MLGASNGTQEHIDVVEQPRTPLPQMQSGADVEHYLTLVWVTRPWMLERHNEGRYGELRMAPSTLHRASCPTMLDPYSPGHAAELAEPPAPSAPPESYRSSTSIENAALGTTLEPRPPEEWGPWPFRRRFPDKGASRSRARRTRSIERGLVGQELRS